MIHSADWLDDLEFVGAEMVDVDLRLVRSVEIRIKLPDIKAGTILATQTNRMLERFKSLVDPKRVTVMSYTQYASGYAVSVVLKVPGDVAMLHDAPVTYSLLDALKAASDLAATHTDILFPTRQELHDPRPRNYRKHGQSRRGWLASLAGG